MAVPFLVKFIHGGVAVLVGTPSAVGTGEKSGKIKLQGGSLPRHGLMMIMEMAQEPTR